MRERIGASSYQLTAPSQRINKKKKECSNLLSAYICFAVYLPSVVFVIYYLSYLTYLTYFTKIAVSGRRSAVSYYFPYCFATIYPSRFTLYDFLTRNSELGTLFRGGITYG